MNTVGDSYCEAVERRPTAAADAARGRAALHCIGALDDTGLSSEAAKTA
ncbi:MAG: hypothetical protein ACXW2Q_04690 [Thermoanaerobaculia bacterium]